MALLIGGAVAVAVLVIVLATSAFGGGSSKPVRNQVVSSTNGAASSSGAAGSTGAVVPGNVTVAVLNGTSVPGLARSVANSLQHDGYKIGTVTNAPLQQHPSTIVAYGLGGRSAARAVAQQIGVDPTTITPEDIGTRGVAGPQATVVVTVGDDRKQ
jgi:LytR cell envelope-related transcriptional attenuator